MDPFRGMGMPRIPGLSDLLSLLQTQTEALAQLPQTLSDLQGTVRELTEATTMARETIESAQRIAERLEGMVEELEEPVRALKPGLERVGRVLDDPAVDTVPDTLRHIHDDLMPLIATLRQAQARVGSVDRAAAAPPRDDDEDEGRLDPGLSRPQAGVVPPSVRLSELSRRTRSPTASSSRAQVELHSTSGPRIRSKTPSCSSKASSWARMAVIDCRWARTVWAIAFS